MTEECAFDTVGNGLSAAKAGVTGARAARKDRAACKCRGSEQSNANELSSGWFFDGVLLG
jgi:hypothetical protein